MSPKMGLLSFDISYNVFHRRMSLFLIMEVSYFTVSSQKTTLFDITSKNQSYVCKFYVLKKTFVPDIFVITYTTYTVHICFGIHPRM